jgi:putative membrane protein
MIAYDPKDWRHLLFALRGTVAVRVLRRVALYGGLTLVLWACHTFTFELPAADPLGHSLLGVALGLLIVFRTNTSYDRYWEARKLWGGLVVTARNLVRGAVAYGGESDGLVRLTTAFPLVLKQHLRGDRDLKEIRPLVSAEVYARVSAAANPPAAVAQAMSAWLRDHLKQGNLDTATARALEGNVCSLVEAAGNCERILQTPIPFAYAAHIKQMLVLYLLTLPFVLVPKMGPLAIVAVAGVAFGLVGIEEAGVEIEDPFGTDANDLPLEEFCATVAADARALTEQPEAERRAA